MPERHDIDMLAEISTLLQYHESLGIKEYPRTGFLESFLQRQRKQVPAEQAGRPAPGKNEPPGKKEKKHIFDAGLTQKVTLRDVREELGDCHRCPLHKTRTNIVFGQGSVSAKLMIVIDAPGGEDDRMADALQGEAGLLFEKMLAAIGLTRENVYITGLVKCYPGPHAKPREEEMKTCLPFLFRQIEIICPSIICSMGMLAAQTLLHSRKSLFQLRGRFYDFNDLCRDQLENRILLMPSLHPSLLLENAELKKASWQDLQMIQKKLAEK